MCHNMHLNLHMGAQARMATVPCAAMTKPERQVAPQDAQDARQRKSRVQ